MSFCMPWHVSFVWIPHPKLPSALSPSFPEPLHKPASAHGNGPSHGGAAGKQIRAVCSMFGAMSRVISLPWKRLRLESFNRTDVAVLTSVPFMIAIVLPEPPLFSLFIRIA